jgi:uncharacterized membrane protein YvbJ
MLEGKMETEKLVSAKDVAVQFVLHYKKWLLIAVAVVAVLAGIISVMQEDPNELINQFEKAVATGDVDELESLVDSDDVDLDEKISASSSTMPKITRIICKKPCKF